MRFQVRPAKGKQWKTVALFHVGELNSISARTYSRFGRLTGYFKLYLKQFRLTSKRDSFFAGY